MNLLRAVPIVGKLGDVSKKSQWEAFIETLLTIIFAALPIILPPFAGFIIPNIEVGKYINKIIDEGELLLYSAAFVGPLIYSILKSREYTPDEKEISRKKLNIMFPEGRPIIFASVVICLLASLIFGLVRIAPLFAHFEVSSQSMLILSGALYIIAVICYYSTAAYRNDLDDVGSIPENFRRSSNDFVQQWDNR